jgi:hypothetical protein
MRFEMVRFLFSIFLMTSVFAASAAEDDSNKFDYSLSSGLSRPGLFSNRSLGNLDNESLGGGFKLHYTQSVKTDAVDCSQHYVEPVAPQVTALAPMAMSIACGQVKTDDSELYSNENCKLLDSCAQMKLSRDEATFTNFLTAPKLAAEDYAGLMMEDRLESMEKLEALRKYADKKFGKMVGASCKPMFDYTSSEEINKTCDKSIIEIGFSNLNSSCNTSVSKCYNLGKDFGKNTPENESSLQNYFTSRIDTKVTDALTSDNEFLDTMSHILTAKTKPEEKLKSLFLKLKEMQDSGKLDPVFGYAENSFSAEDMKKSPHFDFLKKLLAKPLTTATARSEIEKYRRNYTNDVFTKNCKTTFSYVDICKKATDVSAGKSAIYPQRLKAASRLRNVDAKHIDLLKILYPKGILTDKDALVVLNAQRCIALGVNPSRTSIDIIAGPGFGNSATDLFGGFGSGLTIGSPYRASPWAISTGVSGLSYQSPDSSDVKKASNDSVKLNLEDRAKSPELSSGVSSKLSDTGAAAPESEKTLSDSFSDSLKNAGSTSTVTNNQNYNHANTNYNTYSNPVETPAIVEEKSEAKKSVTATSDSSGLNDRISELTKKLSATEDHLAKLKEEREEADEQSAIQKKKEDDSKQISDLKKQINDLKTTPVKAAEVTRASATANNDGPASLAVSAGRSPASEAKAEIDSTGGRAASEAQSAAGARNAAVSGAVSENAVSARVASANAATASAGSSKPLLVLTKVDGMSAEKFSETINDKIIELGGQSFEIEENGIKMVIVPEIKDGKVLLDTKGKPRFVKKLKNAKEEKARVPASVTDKADLLKSEEEKVKRDRAEYRKLKNITNQAVRKD